MIYIIHSKSLYYCCVVFYYGASMSNYRFFFKLSPLGGLGNNNNANNMGGGGQNTNFTYSFHGDPKATFAEFFGTSNPFENFFNLHSTGSGLFTEPLDSGLDSMDDPFAFSSLGTGLPLGL